MEESVLTLFSCPMEPAWLCSIPPAVNSTVISSDGPTHRVVRDTPCVENGTGSGEGAVGAGANRVGLLPGGQRLFPDLTSVEAKDLTSKNCHSKELMLPLMSE